VCYNLRVPAKNAIKDYQPNSYYHVYNRGAFKNTIFKKKEDYWVFREIIRRKLKKMAGKITITPFCLLPTHFHFLLFQQGIHDMESFMRSVMTSYSRYYCKKYGHSGHLCEGPYKAILLPTPHDRQRIRKYILANPIEAGHFNWKHVGDEI
jgi:putative transposase